MSQWVAAVGSTLLVPTGPCNHLFLLVLGPVKLPHYGPHGQVVIVNASSVPATGIPYDATCVLQPGEHPFIRHPSYIAYGHMRLEPEPTVTRNVQCGMWPGHDPCPPAVIGRVVRGVCTSPRTARVFKQMFGC